MVSVTPMEIRVSAALSGGRSGNGADKNCKAKRSNAGWFMGSPPRRKTILSALHHSSFFHGETSVLSRKFDE